MKILFAMSSLEYLRFYDQTIVDLAARGHDVAIAANTSRELKPVRFEALGDTQGRVTNAGLVPPRGDMWVALAHWIRGTLDFVRYLHPQLAHASALRARVKRQGLPLLLQRVDRIASLPADRLRRWMERLAACERVIPVARPLTRFLDEQQPDAVLISPLVEVASEQVDLVRAAQARGIPTAALIASWDNLTNKGDIRVPTDIVVVWNESQRREASDLHRVPPERVVVTGSQVFDRWFGRHPGRDRADFCAMVGLPPHKPFVLFVGSSVFISRANVEVPFVRRWIEALRSSSHPAVRDLAVLIRPHPYNGAQWADADLRGLGDVAVWPRGKHNPVDEANRTDFFDSMYHSDAVVGINTSAMIEAAIVGRPVLSVLTPEFSGTQEGTLHFHHLLPENGGFLRVASTLEAHVDQLAGVLRDPAAARRELAGFVRSFIRPHGVDRACTPIVVDAIERLASGPRPVPLADGALTRVARVCAWPLALFAAVFPEETLRKRRGAKWIRERWRKAVKSLRRRRRAEPRRPARATAVMFFLVAPFLAATALVWVYSVSELAGRTLFVYNAPRNIAEAAGRGSSSEVLRFLKLGQDPRVVMPVGPEVISSSITRVTALEAAIWSRRIRLMRVLQREGHFADPAVRAYLICLAVDIKAQEIQQFLSPNSSDPCQPNATVRAIAARSE
jgi:hypothetical protein